MKRLLIITSVLFITSPAFAKSKVFGELHTSLNPLSTDNGQSSKININEFSVGIKGATELKTDVSLIYQLGWGVSSTSFDGNDSINNRNQVIGLASPKGAIIVGRFDTPFKTVGRKADLFWHSQLGQNRNITNAKTWDLRADKVLVLQSPKMKDFQGSIAYSTDISDTSQLTNNASAISLSGLYKKDKLKVGMAYEQHKLKDTAESRRAIRLSSTYKKDKLKLIGFIQKESNVAVEDADVMGVGIAHKLSAGTVKAQYYVRDAKSSNLDSSLIAVGYDYNVSRKLTVYGQAAKATNDGVLNCCKADELSSNDNISSGFSLGVRYKF